MYANLACVRMQVFANIKNDEVKPIFAFRRPERRTQIFVQFGNDNREGNLWLMNHKLWLDFSSQWENEELDI